MKKRVIFLVGLLFLSEMGHSQISFSEVSSIFPPIQNGESLIEDLDGDGDKDLILTGGSHFNSTTNVFPPFTSMYFNDGAGNFTPSAISNLDSLSFSSVICGDIDNDGDADIFICGLNSSSQLISKVYKNSGSGNFTFVQSTIPGIKNGDAKFGDIDGDNDLDLIFAGTSNSGPISQIYMNDGTGNFTLSPVTITGISNPAIELIDIENDSDLDIVISGNNGISPITQLYKNPGTGQLVLSPTQPFTSVEKGTLAATDVDNDLDMDLILTGYNGTTSVTELYINNGIGTFSVNSSTSFPGKMYSSVLFTDLDQDSDPDLVLSGFDTLTGNTGSHIFRNGGSGVFTELIGLNLAASQNFTNSCGDIDGDTDIELFISGSSDGIDADVSFWYMNKLWSAALTESPEQSSSFVYPNPSHHYFYIPIDMAAEIELVELFSMEGKKMDIQFSSYDNSVDLNFLPQGSYLVRFTSVDKKTFQQVLHKL